MRAPRQSEEKERAYQASETMYQTILTAGWDGEWFLRAYDAFGEKICSKECEEGQIFIEPQGFCVLAGVGVKEGYAEKAMASVKERLDTKYVLSFSSRLMPPITSTWVKFPLIRPDTRKMPVSSVTTIPGSRSVRLSSATETVLSKYIKRPARPTLKTSVRFTGQNLMFTLRW